MTHVREWKQGDGQGELQGRDCCTECQHDEKKRSLGTLMKSYRTASQMDLKERFCKDRTCTRMTNMMLYQSWRKTKPRVAWMSMGE